MVDGVRGALSPGGPSYEEHFVAGRASVQRCADLFGAEEFRVVDGVRNALSPGGPSYEEPS